MGGLQIVSGTHAVRSGNPFDSVGLRTFGVWCLALGAATSTFTFHRVIEHDPQTLFFPEFAGKVVYLSDIFILVGLGTWIVGWVLSPGGSLQHGPWYVFVPVLVLTFLSTLSLLWAADTAVAGLTAIRRILLLAMYIVFVTDGRRGVHVAISALAAAGTLHAVVAVWQSFESSAVGLSILGELSKGALNYESIGASRALGLGFNPNPVGLFLAAVSVMAYSTFLLSSLPSRRAALFLAPFIVTHLGVTATASRTALAAWGLSVVGIAILGWIWRIQNRRTIIKRAGLSLALAAVASGVFTGLLALDAPSKERGEDPSGATARRSRGSTTAMDRFSDLPRDFGSRANDFRLSIPLIRENFLLGVGAGNYSLALNPNPPKDTDGRREGSGRGWVRELQGRWPGVLG